MEYIYRNLLSLREKRGLSQAKLAEKSKVSQTYISEIELGKKNPTIPIVRRLANALEVSITELLNGNEENYWKSNESKKKKPANY